MLSICGTIIFFLVLTRLLCVTGALAVLLWPLRTLLTLLGSDGALAEAIVTGMFEMTAGSKALAEAGLPLRIAASAGAFLFSFGGLCIAAQSMLFLPVKLREYLPLKLAQGVPATEETKQVLLAYCRKNVAKYAMPYDIEFKEDMPKTLVGKVAYRQLEEEELAKIKAAEEK